jgi:hypothetical protein
MGEEQIALFGLSKTEAEKVIDVAPTFDLAQLGVKDTFKCQILDDRPKLVEHSDKMSGEEGKKITTPTLRVKDEFNGMTYTIWLSSKSMKMGFLNVMNQMGTLKDVNVVIGVRLYDHKKWGKDTRAYTVQIDRDKTYVDKSEE